MLKSEKANAKINLVLDVLGKRDDGYHEISTVFQSLDLSDTLTFESRSEGIGLSSNAPALPLNKDNLIWQAAHLLQSHYGVSGGVHIHLHKRIPVAAGLGGGSSDAAAALRGLVRFWHLPWESEVLYALAAQLGSDVAFCLQGGTALGSGRGEILQPLPACPHFYVVLANPGFAVSTAKVYQAFVPDGPNRTGAGGLVAALEAGAREEVKCGLENALERSTFSLYPKVRRLKERMQKTAPSLMCGSGPTVFALFDTKEDAAKLCEQLKAEGISAWLTETVSASLGGGENV
ncbi:4-(cytidine 5'-diphospho)-2-C-methyl-D-erythritol kinase [Dethiobacter alkaliphilus]|uniref:4-diphosphocytidyl-2-C-methyl-D-erythritol kinase n=1 Tax=Dethiobacter alkaliphilus AHT 1 TaxID=555088 RepID=C0GJC5_DETAL|nr:4-(cytidine 5'-diphospho)-2-C-methyl-D-erythritol kinase [Dethiobacter alkaliphilus]EEG76610.1 4-diphosphocytidyl-2C-methyl-D-erythritol kinase [Dethiobacter alkaliphilus AHT 1]